MAFSLLRLCASLGKHVHLSRTTPPSHCSDSLTFWDDDVRSCLSSCLAVDIPDSNWTQAQLSPSMGGFGLRSLSGHSPAAFIFSLAALGSGLGNLDNVDLQQAVTHFNSQVSPQDDIIIEAILASPPPQSSLSKK